MALVATDQRKCGVITARKDYIDRHRCQVLDLKVSLRRHLECHRRLRREQRIRRAEKNTPLRLPRASPSVGTAIAIEVAADENSL